MIYGCEIPHSDKPINPKSMIMKVLEQVQLHLYGQSKKQEEEKEEEVETERIELVIKPQPEVKAPTV
jgi:hypothetical protein